VPQMTGRTVSEAIAAWGAAGFTGPVDVSPNGANGSWQVTVQFPAFPSSPLVCTTGASLTARNR
jgi:hypothetical protein